MSFIASSSTGRWTWRTARRLDGVAERFARRRIDRAGRGARRTWRRRRVPRRRWRRVPRRRWRRVRGGGAAAPRATRRTAGDTGRTRQRQLRQPQRQRQQQPDERQRQSQHGRAPGGASVRARALRTWRAPLLRASPVLVSPLHGPTGGASGSARSARSSRRWPRPRSSSASPTRSTATTQGVWYAPASGGYNGRHCAGRRDGDDDPVGRGHGEPDEHTTITAAATTRRAAAATRSSRRRPARSSSTCPRAAKRSPSAIRRREVRRDLLPADRKGRQADVRGRRGMRGAVGKGAIGSVQPFALAPRKRGEGGVRGPRFTRDLEPAPDAAEQPGSARARRVSGGAWSRLS